MIVLNGWPRSSIAEWASEPAIGVVFGAIRSYDHGMIQEPPNKIARVSVVDAIVALPPLEQGLLAAGRRGAKAKKPFDPVFATVRATATIERGRDGRSVRIPVGCIAAQGRDGRMVALPAGSGSLQGTDGRIVAIPKGYLGIENAKGRIVPKARW